MQALPPQPAASRAPDGGPGGTQQGDCLTNLPIGGTVAGGREGGLAGDLLYHHRWLEGVSPGPAAPGQPPPHYIHCQQPQLLLLPADADAKCYDLSN
jgi:hypothetical protein